ETVSMRRGRIRMIAIASILPLLFLAIWLFVVKMPGPAFAGPLPPLTPNQALIRSALQRHVTVLAHDIGVRSDETYSNVLRASAYIERRLQDLGYSVVSQQFSARNRSYRNIEATLPGVPGHAHEVVVLGAHYDQIVAMLSIESIGYYDTEKGSQRYPFPLNLAYPNVGDFIGFVSNLRSRALLHRAIAAFRAHATLPTQGAAAPSWVPGVGWS